MEDHESDVLKKEREEIDDIFLHQQPLIKHNLPVEDLGTTLPPKEDPIFELKPLPDDLKYAYIDNKKIYPVIISSKLSRKEEERLLEILRKHRGAMGYTLDDLKEICPTLCQHAINMEDDAKPVVEHQRCLIPKMNDVVRTEVLKLLDAGIIYPRDFYFRALGSLVVLSFHQLLSFSSVLSKPLSETVTQVLERPVARRRTPLTVYC
jgi:hypothetical protein